MCVCVCVCVCLCVCVMLIPIVVREHGTVTGNLEKDWRK